MRKNDLARLLARRTRTSRASAADRLDHVVHRILTQLRKGEAVALPGLGRLEPGDRVRLTPEDGHGKR